MRKPKDPKRFITAWIAAGRLINLATERILFLNPGIRVRWTLSISYHYTDEFDAKGAKVLPMGGSFHSGE